MRKFKSVIIMALVALMVLTGCKSTEEPIPSRTTYYVDNEIYCVQEEGFFTRPANPSVREDQGFLGWALAGSDELYRDWNVQPEGETVMEAVIEDYNTIKFYVGGNEWKTMLETEFVEPGTPVTTATRDQRSLFSGWYPEGSDQAVTDWSQRDPEVTRYDARFVDLVHFYLNGQIWKSERLDEFGYPGDLVGKDIPRGYEFLGWVPVNDYVPYEDWATCPEGVRRFDALLTTVSLEDSIGANNPAIELNLAKDFKVLGPVTVEEKYEVVNGDVRVGGIGYNDMIAAALEKYPDTDQVINIVFDKEYQTYETVLDTLVFETKVATGIAIDIVDAE